MVDTPTAMSLLTILEIVAPILLAGALIYGTGGRAHLRYAGCLDRGQRIAQDCRAHPGRRVNCQEEWEGQNGG